MRRTTISFRSGLTVRMASTFAQAIDAYISSSFHRNYLAEAWPAVHSPAQIAFDPECGFAESKCSVFHVH